jgi:hypothetical protein
MALSASKFAKPGPSSYKVLYGYRIPKNCNSAAIVISEVGSGKIISAIPVSCSETHFAIDAGTLAGGNYSYPLHVVMGN